MFLFLSLLLVVLDVLVVFAVVVEMIVPIVVVFAVAVVVVVVFGCGGVVVVIVLFVVVDGGVDVYVDGGVDVYVVVFGIGCAFCCGCFYPFYNGVVVLVTIVVEIGVATVVLDVVIVVNCCLW